MRTVLIVEDDELHQDILSKTVIAMGLNPVIKKDGLAAILHMHSHGDDVSAILLDIYMPQVDGISTLGHLRNRHPDLPVIVISASKDESDERAVKSLGIAAYLKKPLVPEQVRETLKKCLFG